MYTQWNRNYGARKKNYGSRMDYIVVSNSLMNSVVSSDIHNEYWGSDHCPLSLTMDYEKLTEKEEPSIKTADE